jgi:hypothetical protein
MIRSNAQKIGITLTAMVGIALPATALAAGGENGAQIAIAPARAVQVPALERPTKRLQATIAVQVKQIRADRRAKLRKQRREAFATLPGGVSQATLDSIAACESGGDPTVVDASGTYRGKYQFDYGTWASVGGSGDPAAAPEAEQDYRAALLYTRSGSSPWPICG